MPPTATIANITESLPPLPPSPPTGKKAVPHALANLSRAVATFFSLLVLPLLQSDSAYAQLAPEIGYMHPAGAQAGTATEVTLGGYDWTPDTQLFVHDPRIKLELIGPLSPVLVPEPPHWFGFKARGPAWPLPREVKARLTIPADVPPGFVRWQVANANGASPPATFQVGASPEIIEDANRKSAQVLPALPVTVSGQIRRIEEIDRYEFKVPRAGPVTIQVAARQLSSPLHAMLKVRDAQGRVILDAADTEGRDLSLTMIAQADTPYEISLHDLDFAGDRSYVYRLTLIAAPHISASYVAAGTRGKTHPVEFVGIGLATGTNTLETVLRDVTFPSDPSVKSFPYVLETPWGNTPPYTLGVSDLEETVQPPSKESPLAAPGGRTSYFDTRFGVDQHIVSFKQGERWNIATHARSIHSPLDLELTIFGPEGKQLASVDDATPGTTDPELLFTAPLDGDYRIVIADRSGKSGSRAANYRISIERPREDVALSMPTQLAIPIGAQSKLAIKAARTGGFKGPIPLAFDNLPAGVMSPTALVIPEGANELTIDLTCAADAPANALLCRLTATPKLGEQAVSRDVGRILLATTMKPRIKLTPEGLDDVRKIHRGSTFLAPMLIERLENYEGPVTLEMTSKQQRHRQGLASEEMVVAANGSPGMPQRVEYPIFVPEWMETTKTSRMILNASVQVADPKGNIRTLLQRQELRIGILPEGALMKLSHTAGEPTVLLGGEIRVPVSLSRVAEFREPVRIELVPDEARTGEVAAEPLQLTPDQTEGTILIRFGSAMGTLGEQSVTIRATALKEGRRPVISETTVLVTIIAR